MMWKNKIYLGDVRSRVKELPDNYIDCIVTSPPYFGLRDYGMEGQIGLEETPEQFISELVCTLRECRRALKDDGTLWLNIGDSYAGNANNKNYSNDGKNAGISKRASDRGSIKGCKPKDLIGIPWMLAFALRADGWYLRQDIIWSKPNPMPESVTDRCTKSHEYIFLLSKSNTYYFDQKAIKQPLAASSIPRLKQDIEKQEGSKRVPGKTNGVMKAVGRYDSSNEPEDANKKSVWTVSTMPFKDAHFATFPERLIVDCIKAGCREDGIVLDPFMGAGTTALVARKLNRNYIGFEINPDYITIAENRLNGLGMFR